MTEVDESDGDGEPEAQPIYPSRGPDREEMAASYLPEQDQWLAKTILDLNDPAAIAALGQFGQMFPEVDDLQPIIDEFLEEFMTGRTSVGGQSREEYQGIIKSMFGGGVDEETKKWATLLGADQDD